MFVSTRTFSGKPKRQLVIKHSANLQYLMLKSNLELFWLAYRFFLDVFSDMQIQMMMARIILRKNISWKI